QRRHACNHVLLCLPLSVCRWTRTVEHRRGAQQDLIDTRSRCVLVEPASRSILLLEHDPFGKPVSTFPDHALSIHVHSQPRRANRHGGVFSDEIVGFSFPKASFQAARPLRSSNYAAPTTS